MNRPDVSGLRSKDVGWKDAGLSILTALLIVFSFPKFELPHLIWVAFLPYLIAIQNKSPKQAFGLGFIVGVVTTIGGSYWIIHTLQEFGRLPLAAAIPIFFIFCLFNNLHFAIFGWLLRSFSLASLRGAPRIIFIPIAFTVVEYLFPQVFSWYLGACLYKQLWLIQPADITGVYGFSFLIVCVNAAGFELYLWLRAQRLSFPKYECLVLMLFFCCCIAYSYLRLAHFRELLTQSPKIRAALIQTNIGNLDKFESSHGYPYAVQKTREINKELVLKASQTKGRHPHGLDLIVLPETAAPGYFTEDQLGNRLEMFQLASQANAPLAFGGYYKTESPLKIYNTLFLISPHFQVLGRYDKVNLLAFGEYMPASNTFTFLKNIVPTVGDFSKGDEIKILSLPNEISFAPLICLEAIYPNYVRKFIKKGARFIVTITNDSWFGDTAAPYQHRMLHVWRAIENRAPLLRTANTGISTFVDLTGRIQSETPLFQEAILVDDAAVISEKSFYTKFGVLFVYLLIGLFALFLIPKWRTLKPH
jgi:apolipoprotein N-acyltransferase